MSKQVRGLLPFVLMLACAAMPVASVAADAPAKPAAKPASAKDLARGKYLVDGPAACGNCHTARGPDLRSLKTNLFAGGHPFADNGFLAFSRNITPDKDTGIGSWTDAQIIRAIREGVNKEGETLGPPMPFAVYNNMSDDDARAIVAYLRTVKPVRNQPKPSKYEFPLKPQPAAKGTAAPNPGDKVAYGGYLVNAVAHCLECHTPMVGPQFDYANQTGAGGLEIKLPNIVLRTTNITPDKETGIGAWTDAEIKRAITDGIARDGRKLNPIMPHPYFKKMTAPDVEAIVAYLRTLKPVSKKIEPNMPVEEMIKKLAQK